MTILFGLCSVLSGVAAGWLAIVGITLVAETRREKLAITLKVATLAAVALGAIAGGVLSIAR